MIDILLKASERKDVTFDEEPQKRIKRSDGDDLYHIEMTLVADKYTIKFHGDKTAKFLLMLANLVSSQTCDVHNVFVNYVIHPKAIFLGTRADEF